MCLPHDAEEQNWSLIGQQIASDDWLKTNTQDDTDPVNKTMSKPNEKRLKVMEPDSESEEGVKNTSDKVLYKMAKNVVESVDPLQRWKLNIDIRELHFVKTVLCIPATSAPCEGLFRSAGNNVNKTRSSLEPNTVDMFV